MEFSHWKPPFGNVSSELYFEIVPLELSHWYFPFGFSLEVSHWFFFIWDFSRTLFVEVLPVENVPLEISDCFFLCGIFPLVLLGILPFDFSLCLSAFCGTLEVSPPALSMETRPVVAH